MTDKQTAIRASTSFSPSEVDELLHALDLRARAYQSTPSELLLSIARKVNVMKMTIRRKQRERDEPT